MIAVENHTGSHHVSPTLRARSDGGAVGHVHDAGVDAELAQALQRGEKILFLLARLLTLRRRREGFGGSEVRHYAAEAKMFAFGELAGEAFHIAGGSAQGVRPG